MMQLIPFQKFSTCFRYDVKFKTYAIKFVKSDGSL